MIVLQKMRKIGLSTVLVFACQGLLPAQDFLFKDRTAAAGIVHDFRGLSPEMGSGVVFFDINNDDLPDLFFPGGDSTNGLFLNKGGGIFEDISAGSGLASTSNKRYNGAVSGDIDNDGFRDLFVTTELQNHCLLFRNLGNNTFQDITYSSGIALVSGGLLEDKWGFSPAMGDINLDGYLDIYVSNWIADFRALFDPQTGAVVGYAHRGGPNRLYLNKGNLTFAEVAPQYGVDDKGCSLSSIFSDYDNDRDMDILIANDFGKWWIPDALYKNQYPEKACTNESMASGFNTALYGMGIGVGDYDKDGDLDYYKTSIGAHVLLQNKGNGTFEEVGAAAGVRQEFINDQPPYLSIGWGAGFVDVDNDSWLDLVVAEGAMLKPDFFLPSLDSLPDKVFLNKGDGTFEDSPQLFETPNLKMSRGFAYGDIDNDGDMDLVFSCTRDYMASLQPGSPVLFQNQLDSSKHWLKVKLVGTRNNRDAFGAHIVIHVKGESWVTEIDGGGQGHNSQHSSIAHFGLGQAERVDSILVQWPGHFSPDQVFYDIPANFFIKITEGQAKYEVIQGKLVSGGGLVGIPKKGISVFPNPAKDYVRVSLNTHATGTAALTVRDLLGRPVRALSFLLSSPTPTLYADLSGLPTGAYFLEIQAGQERWQQRILLE